MKIKFNLLVAAGIFIAISLIQFSCSSSKKSAVPCPDFSRSRNMKSRHTQLNFTYPEQQHKSRINPTWARSTGILIAARGVDSAKAVAKIS